MLNLLIYHKPYQVENKLYQDDFCKESLFPVIINFPILCLFFLNGPQALEVKPGCFKCISGINLSAANKNLHNFVHFYMVKIKYHLTKNFFNGVLSPKLVLSFFLKKTFESKFSGFFSTLYKISQIKLIK